MTCKECKFSIKKKDCFTGAYYYECSNEIAPIPFNTTNDFVIADSKIVVNCNAGEEKPNGYIK